MISEEKRIKQRESSRRYYRKNKEKILAHQKEYVRKKYAEDAEFRAKTYQRNRKYVENNKEKVREMKRNWARKHYEELRKLGIKKPTKKELEDRISKAIEYIESYMPNYDFDKTNLRKVLDILKGVDKE